MCPAHVSFLIDQTLTDTPGDGSSLTLLLFQRRAMGTRAVDSTTMAVVVEALKEIKNALLPCV